MDGYAIPVGPVFGLRKHTVSLGSNMATPSPCALRCSGASSNSDEASTCCSPITDEQDLDTDFAVMLLILDVVGFVCIQETSLS